MVLQGSRFMLMSRIMTDLHPRLENAHSGFLRKTITDPSGNLLKPVRAIIFDMDGLMFDTERLMFEMWNRACEGTGYTISAELFASTVGVSAEGTRELLLEGLGQDFPYDSLRERRISIERTILEERGVPEKKGLRELLDFASSRSLKVAVGTSTDSRRALPLLRRSGLYGRFHALVCGDQVRACKPEPDIYLAVMEKLGVNPAECLVLEDSEAGIEAAFRAGALPVMIPDIIEPGELTLKRLIARFTDLNAVRQWLSGD